MNLSEVKEEKKEQQKEQKEPKDQKEQQKEQKEQKEKDQKEDENEEKLRKEKEELERRKAFALQRYISLSLSFLLFFCASTEGIVTPSDILHFLYSIFLHEEGPATVS